VSGLGVDGVLPEGWAECRLGGVVEFRYGKGLPEKIRKQGLIPVYGSNGVVGTHSAAVSGGTTIVVGRKGSVGEIHLCEGPCWPIDTTYFIENFGPFDPRFLTHLLRHLDLAQDESSTAIPGLNREDAYNRIASIAPLPEQRRIVAKVEGLLAEVNRANARLTRVQAIIKRFRRSVLSAACSGELTREWREQHPEESGKTLLKAIRRTAEASVKRQRSTGSGDYQLADVPDTWGIGRIGEMVTLVTSGSRGWAEFYSDQGPIFIRAQDINTDVLDLSEVAHVSLPRASEGSRTLVQPSDLLVTITGANVTKTALVEDDLGEAYVSQHVGLVRPAIAAVSPWLHSWLISPGHGRKQLLDAAYGAGKPGLNLDNLRDVAVAVPPLAEQHEIQTRVQSLLTLVTRIEERLAPVLRSVEALPRAILFKAFSGELVPTEAELARLEGRDYESASSLLERAKKAEDPAATKMKRPRSRRQQRVTA
jgi:type I restriction enzyme, S subunit